MHMSFSNHRHAKPLFMEEGKLANIQRWPCILLSVDFTLHKINLFIGTKYTLLLYFQVKE